MSLSGLRARVRGRPARGRVLEALPYLGLDIESASGDSVRVEYSPNRPDYSTEYGIAAGLEGLLSAAAGPAVAAPRAARARLRSEKPAARPVIMGACAAGGRVDGRMIRQLISMQDDLDAGIGRGRRRSSIGIHDMDRMRFPLTYGQAPRRSAGFAPLGTEEEMSLAEVLRRTEQGRKYSGLLGAGPVPVLRDADGRTISLPPVVNSERTAVREGTRSLFVEATGHEAERVEDALSVVAFTLGRAGFAVSRLPGAGLAGRRLSVDAGEISSVLGVRVSAAEAARCLRRARLSASAAGARVTCVVPRHRFDLRNSRDLAEEAALGYGVWRLEPRMPAWSVPGSRDAQTVALERAAMAMVGLGYTEVINTCLAPELPGSAGGLLRVADPKEGGAFLRGSLLPGLAATLSANVHRPYPQRIFETGEAFARGRPVRERLLLASVSAHAGAGFSEAKSAAVAALAALGASASTRAFSDPALQEGRAARLVAGGRTVGKVGEIASAVASAHRLRVPAAGFEVDLGLIFDAGAGRGAHKSNRADGRGRAGRTAQA